jgi:hypothetical protein
MSYYQKVARHYDAQMDDDDYGMNDSYSTLEKVEKTRQAMEDAMRDMVEKENEMNEKCK